MSKEEIERLDDQGMAAWDGHDAQAFANLFADALTMNDVAMGTGTYFARIKDGKIVEFNSTQTSRA
jgi:hypothetical protein